MLSPRDQSGLG